MRVELEIPEFLVEEMQVHGYLGQFNIPTAIFALLCGALVDTFDVVKFDESMRKFIETNYPDLHTVCQE